MSMARHFLVASKNSGFVHVVSASCVPVICNGKQLARLKVGKRLAFLIPAFLFAGEEYLGDFGVVLITPRSIPTDISKLTRKVTVLDKEEIKNIPADSISEVLNYVSGTDSTFDVAGFSYEL